MEIFLPKKRRSNLKPIALGLDGIGGLIVALLLWLLPLNPYSYAIGSVILAGLVVVFIWFASLALTDGKLARSAISAASVMILALVLLPEGLDRFDQKLEARSMPAAKDQGAAKPPTTLAANPNAPAPPVPNRDCKGLIDVSGSKGGALDMNFNFITGYDTIVCGQGTENFKIRGGHNVISAGPTRP